MRVDSKTMVFGKTREHGVPRNYSIARPVENALFLSKKVQKSLEKFQKMTKNAMKKTLSAAPLAEMLAKAREQLRNVNSPKSVNDAPGLYQLWHGRLARGLIPLRDSQITPQLWHGRLARGLNCGKAALGCK